MKYETKTPSYQWGRSGEHSSAPPTSSIFEIRHRRFITEIDKKEKGKEKIKMAGRLGQVASRIMGGNGVVSRSVASSLRQRSGMGLPVGKPRVPDRPVNPLFFFFSFYFHFLQPV